jgi:acyl-CoA reductase-like NAD-dependent aldehyde dehydrogenase
VALSERLTGVTTGYVYHPSRRSNAVDEAIEMVNSTDYDNASSIFTERGSEARQYRYEVDAGNIGVNVGVCAPMGFLHFGGRKGSFFGDPTRFADHVKHAEPDTTESEQYPQTQ